MLQEMRNLLKFKFIFFLYLILFFACADPCQEEWDVVPCKEFELFETYKVNGVWVTNGDYLRIVTESSCLNCIDATLNFDFETKKYIFDFDAFIKDTTITFYQEGEFEFIPGETSHFGCYKTYQGNLKFYDEQNEFTNDVEYGVGCISNAFSLTNFTFKNTSDTLRITFSHE